MKSILFLILLTGNIVYAQQVIRGPYLQSPTETTITIMWRTNVPTNSTVWFGQNPQQLNQTASGNSNTTEHTVLVTGLNPNTKYYYAVGSQSIYGGNSANHYFHTNPVIGSQDSIRVWAIGDFGKGNAGQIAVKNSFLSWNGQNKTDVWLWLGDNAYNDGKDSDYQSKVFGLAGFSDIFSFLPFWPTPGNHDYNTVWQESTFLGIPYSNIPLENHEGPYFNIVDVPTQAEAGGFPSNLEVFYSFDYANVHFLSLNSEVYDYAQTGTGINRMINYINDDLSQNQQDFTIAYFHQPPYSKGSHDSDDLYEDVMRTMREEIIPVLESYDIDLIVCGHSHVFERSFLIKNHYGYSDTWDPLQHLVSGTNGNFAAGNAYIKDKYNQQNDGAVYVVCGHSGSENSDGSMDHPVFCYDDNGTGVTGSFVIDIYRNRLDGKYLRSDGTIQDEFTILKKNVPALYIIDTLCLGESMTLAAVLSGGSDSLSFLWNGNGETQNQITVSPLQSNVYTCNVTDHLTNQQTTSTYQIHVQECVNKVGESLLNPFILYPNPSKGKVEIYAEEAIQVLRVMDEHGKLVYHTFPQKNLLSLSLSHLPAGNYTFEAILSSGTYRKSLILAP